MSSTATRPVLADEPDRRPRRKISRTVSNDVRNLIVGVIGSFVGGYVLNLAGVRLPIDNVWVSSIVTATIGALIVIVVARVVAK